MQKKSLSLSLRLWEASFLALCIVLALFLVFYFGYRAGHSVGYDTASHAAFATTPRYNIDDTKSYELDKNQVENIFARLKDDQIKSYVEEEEREEGVLEEFEEVILDVNSNLPENSIEGEQELFTVVEGDSEVLSEDLLEVNTVEETVEQEVETIEEEVQEVAVTEKIDEVKEEVVIEKPEQVEEIIEEVEKVEEETLSFSKASSGWYAQISSTSDVKVAKNLEKSLKDNGFPVVIEKIDRQGKAYYRVLSGPEASRNYAERLKEQLSREPNVPGSPFVKYIE